MEDVLFWEISEASDRDEVSAHETSIENEISDIRNKFYQLAKACGMESEFSSDLDLEAAISCLATPSKTAPFMDTLVVSPEGNEKSRRRKLSYADRILAELIAECSTDSSDMMTSISDDVKEDSMPPKNKLDSCVYPCDLQYTSYRKAVEFNPMFSYAANDDVAVRDSSFSSSSSTSLSNGDCSSDVSDHSAECLSDNQRVPSPEGYDLMTELMSRTHYCAEYIDNQRLVKSEENTSVLDDTAPVFERLQPDGAEDEPVRQISLGSSRTTSSSSQSGFEGLSAASYSRRMRDSANSKTSRSSRSSRGSASSRPLASSTMIEDVSLSEYQHGRDECCAMSNSNHSKTKKRKSSVLSPHSVRKQMLRHQPSKTEDNTLNLMSEQCTLQFMEPLSVIEPVNRDAYISTTDGATDEKQTGSLPRTSTQIWHTTYSNKKAAQQLSNHPELSPPSNFHSVPVSPQSAGKRLIRNQYKNVRGAEDLRASAQSNYESEFSDGESLFLDSETSSKQSGIYAPCNSFISSQTDSEISAIVPESSQTGTLFKMPTSIPAKRLGGISAQNLVKRVVRRTSTPLPSLSPRSQKNGCKRSNSDSQSGFDRKSLARKLKRFKNSFSKEKKPIPETTPLASF